MFQFILAVLFVELTPGPNMAYLASLSLARGRTAGLFAIVGVALGLSVHAAVASFAVLFVELTPGPNMAELENCFFYIHGSMRSFAGLA